MRTSDLIKLLQAEDPNDECVICVGNRPVYDGWKDHYYYDGALEMVERDENRKPIRVGYPSGGFKLNLRVDDIEDALLDNPDAELVLDGITYGGEVSQRHMDYLNKWIKEGRECQVWKTEFDEARKNGMEPPPFARPSFKQRMRWAINRWLDRLGMTE